MSLTKNKSFAGFSLKDTNKTGTYYIYIWDKDTCHKVVGKNGKVNSKVNGWKSIGNYEDPESFDKLMKWLKIKYPNQYSTIDVSENLKNQFYEQEEKRISILTSMQEEVKNLCLKKNLPVIQPTSIKSAKNWLKKLKD